MITIKPFSALRPDKAIAAQLASPPYDVLSSGEARALAKNNPVSFLHITKAEIDLPADTPVHSKAVYEKARENLDAFIKQGRLFQEAQPCYYIYRLTWNGRSQTGLVAASSVADYENGLIKKHEFTRPEKEQDRIDHMRTIGAQTGKVFLAYKNVAALDLLVSDWKTNHQPAYDFTATDGVQHTVWVVNAAEIITTITRLFKDKVPATYIADGHHRAASAAKVSKALPDHPEAAFFSPSFFLQVNLPLWIITVW